MSSASVRLLTFETSLIGCLLKRWRKRYGKQTFQPIGGVTGGFFLEVFTCTSRLLLLPCSSLLLWLCSVTSDLVALFSFGEDTVSAASETFIVSVSTVSDILIAKSYCEMLANTENLQETKHVHERLFTLTNYGKGSLMIRSQ